MKTRIVSMVLSFCLVLGLFCGLSGAAYADNTIKYTLKSGETVFSVCQSLGIDFFANYDWITKTNGITNYSTLKAGTVLTLPAPSSKVESVTGTTVLVDSNTDKSLLAGDYISGYLISHVLQGGETVFALCQSYGVDFEANSETIKKLSAIQSYNNLKVGQLIILPTMTAPTSGAYYKVVAHPVAAGDTVGAICKSYGLDYKTNEARLKALNNKENLGAIKVGQIIYLPIPTSAGTAASSGTGTTVTPVKPASGTGTSATSTNTASALPIRTDTHGTFVLQVNGKVVNSAKPGETVTIVASPDSGYRVSAITVSALNAPLSVPVTNGSFVMPDYEVIINVSFRAT